MGPRRRPHSRPDGATHSTPRRGERVRDRRSDTTPWGPPSHPATFVDHSLTPGSRVTYYMTGPDGEKYAGYWDITTVDEPTSFTFRDGFADADLNPNPDMPVSENTYTFTEHNGGTRAVYVSTFASAEGLQQVLDMGVVEGATSAINQIDELLAS
ncbi:SRPBCC domain-containing protein [Mycobacterium sp. ELW1]|nr:SRPBCC domain-containing protein [Mycobacterium sp. ELW1]